MISKEITSCNILKCSVETNCPQGGDSGHGGRTKFILENLASTDMSILVHGDALEPDKIEIMFGGDSECETFIEALQFAQQTLKQIVKNNMDKK